jgi:nucleoside-diphosphate kinase
MERSLFIIKPDAVRRSLIGQILAMVEGSGLKVAELRLLRLTPDDAGGFYRVHEGKHFFEKLVAYMSSGESVVAVIEGENAIQRLRAVCGVTDPSKASEGTIRASFGINITMNSVHASDSPASADQEVSFFFPESD